MSKGRKARRPSRKELVGDFVRGRLLGTLFGKYAHSWARDAEIVQAIASAHNAGAINLLTIVSDEALEKKGKFDFFAGQSLYCALIPELQADAGEMVRVLDCLIRAAGNDGAAGLPRNALARWCDADPARAGELLRLVDEGHATARSIIPLALRKAVPEVRSALLAHIHSAANGEAGPDRCNALFGLGQIDPASSAEWSLLLSTLHEGARAQDESVRAAALAAAMLRLRAGAGSFGEQAEQVISAAIEFGCGERVLHQCADALWMDGEHVSEPLQDRMLASLLAVDPANVGTVRTIDRALASLVRHGRAERAIAFLADLLLQANSTITLRQFDSTARAVHEQPPEALHDWLVGWLLDGRFALCEHLARGVIGGQIRESVLEIDFARFALRSADFPYLARKAIGFLFFQPLTAASFILSLVRSAPRSGVAELEDLLFDPMLLNYGGFARTLLEPVAKRKGDPARSTARNALARIKVYLADLEAARAVTELRPSERERRAEWHRHTDMMAETYRQADQKSALADLFKKVVVLYGNGSVSYIRHPKLETRRIESRLQKHGVSIEVPRVEIVDPVGLQKMLLYFRTERRPA